MVKFFTPAIEISSSRGESVKPVFDEISRRLNERKAFRACPNNSEYPHARIFVKGNAFVSLMDDLIPLFRYEGYFFPLVEWDESNNRVLFSLHNFSYSKREEELEKFLPLIEGLSMGEVNYSSWYESSELPEELLSHSWTFLKSRGLKGIL